MKTWLRGKRWEVQPGQALHRFPIHADKFDENELILPIHLTAEGFPSVWGPAHAFTIRLQHSQLKMERDKDSEAYRTQCRQAAIDLLHLVLGQFFDLLQADEIPLRFRLADGSETPAASRWLRLLYDSLEAEQREAPVLVVLRAAGTTNAPIAAINFADCLWFPVHSYKMTALAERIERLVGRVEPERLVLPGGLGEEAQAELLYRVAQLRTYLDFLWRELEEAPAVKAVLSRFLFGLRNVAQPAEISIRGGRAYRRAGGASRPLDLFLSRAEPGGDLGVCPTCQDDWRNHPYKGELYPDGRLVLQGGAKPSRKLLCPEHNAEISGWQDLLSRSVFFDEVSASYVIWEDDPNDVGTSRLQFPPDARRLDVKRGVGKEPGSVRFLFNKAEVEVRGRVVHRSKVLLPKLVELPRGSEAHLLPLDGDYAECVDWGKGGVVEDRERPGTWKAHLRGWQRPWEWSVSRFCEEGLSDAGAAALLLWPGFEDPAWQAETVVFALRSEKTPPPPAPWLRCYLAETREKSADGADEKKQRVLPVDLKNPDTELAGTGIRGTVFHSRNRIEALELRSPGGLPWGFVKPQRRPLKPSKVVTGTLALDFGTSNTVAAWLPTGEREPSALATDAHASPLELLAPPSQPEKEQFAGALSLLPFWPARPPGRWLIPSELFQIHKAQRWTLPNDTLAPGSFELIYRDFKWQDDASKLRPAFLGLVLPMVLADLRARSVHTVRLRATYPLAFEPARLREYATLLQGLVSDLAKQTGMTLSLAGYADESISGLEACGRRSGNVHCVIDVGGGTTDIAVRVASAKAKGEAAKPGASFADSLRLAGNDVLESLLADDTLVDALQRYGHDRFGQVGGDPKGASWQVMLRDLRSSPTTAPAFWNHLATRQVASAQRFSARNRAFFDALLAYAVRLIDATEAEMRGTGALPAGERADVTIFLIGQGWGLLRLQVEDGDAEPNTYVSRRLSELAAVLPGRKEEFRASVMSPGFLVNGSPKLATSFGAAQLREGLLRKPTELAGASGKRTILGLNVEFYDQQTLSASGRLHDQQLIQGTVRRHDGWEAFVQPLLSSPQVTEHVRNLFGPSEAERKHFVDTRLNDLIAKHMEDQLNAQEKLQKTPLQLLIEQVWAERLKHLEIGSS